MRNIRPLVENASKSSKKRIRAEIMRRKFKTIIYVIIKRHVSSARMRYGWYEATVDEDLWNNSYTSFQGYRS